MSDGTLRPVGYARLGDEAEWHVYQKQVAELAELKGYSVHFRRGRDAEVGQTPTPQYDCSWLSLDNSTVIEADRYRLFDFILRQPQLLAEDDQTEGYRVLSPPTMGDPSVELADDPIEQIWSEADEWARVRWAKFLASGSAYSEIQAAMKTLHGRVVTLPNRVRRSQMFVRGALLALLNEGVEAIEVGGEFGGFSDYWTDPPAPLEKDAVIESNGLLLLLGEAIPFNLSTGHPLLTFYLYVAGLWTSAATGADLEYLAYVLEETCRVFPIHPIVEAATGEALLEGEKVLHTEFRGAYLLSEKRRALAKLVEKGEEPLVPALFNKDAFCKVARDIGWTKDEHGAYFWYANSQRVIFNLAVEKVGGTPYGGIENGYQSWRQGMRNRGYNEPPE